MISPRDSEFASRRAEKMLEAVDVDLSAVLSPTHPATRASPETASVHEHWKPRSRHPVSHYLVEGRRGDALLATTVCSQLARVRGLARMMKPLPHVQVGSGLPNCPACQGEQHVSKPRTSGHRHSDLSMAPATRYGAMLWSGLSVPTPPPIRPGSEVVESSPCRRTLFSTWQPSRQRLHANQRDSWLCTTICSPAPHEPQRLHTPKHLTKPTCPTENPASFSTCVSSCAASSGRTHGCPAAATTRSFQMERRVLGCLEPGKGVPS